MSNLINLSFESLPVRIIDQKGDFWFVASDVCNVLEIQNTTDALKALDDDEKAKLEVSPSFNLGLDHRVREINIINESGLYILILRSRKAMQQGTVQHKFRKWVTSEVLPSIRKTGSYRHTISTEQQAQIQKAIKAKCQHNSVHYQTIYTALKNKFGIPRYDELLAKDFDDAIAFIEQYQFSNDAPDNAFWCMVGILEYDRISRELDALERTLDSVMRQLTHIRRTKGLLYDALGEQNHISQDPDLVAKAQAFIDRQMAMKRRIGFI